MERNVTLDFVRGVAILGILLLNISAFGLPKAAYLNPAWSGNISASDAWTWAILDLLAQVKFLTLFALLFGAGLQLLLPRGKRWIQSRLTLLALLGFIHGLFFWDGDILLAYALVGLVGWRMVRDAQDVKSLFNTGVVLYVIGVAVLLLLGLISGNTPNRSWLPDAANLQYEQYWKLKGGFEAVSNRADMLSDNLLALGAQYGWQLAGMMLMGAALMRSGWLKGQFSLRHYRRTGVLLIAAGMAVNLPSDYCPVASWLGLPLVRIFATGAAGAGRAAANHRLRGAGLGLLAAAVSESSGGGDCLRRAHGANQLSAADPDLHYPVLPLRPVYEV
ncbi:inner membrane protein [Klebsiella michiganensis]|uniref:Inner membrane protein n=1 Tax=Klebsiella michiganensis TaxID=1134687 RepID=A0A7H4MV44_9ENTR|nr:inner membrane protein [Klebsiella michiganensis]